MLKKKGEVFRTCTLAPSFPAMALKEQLAKAVSEAVALRTAVPLECIAYSLMVADPVPCSALSEEQYVAHHDLQASLQAVVASVVEPSAATLGAALLAASEARRCSGVDELRAELACVEAERARLVELLRPTPSRVASATARRAPVQWPKEAEVEVARADEAEAAFAANARARAAAVRSVRACPAPLELPASPGGLEVVTDAAGPLPVSSGGGARLSWWRETAPRRVAEAEELRREEEQQTRTRAEAEAAAAERRRQAGLAKASAALGARAERVRQKGEEAQRRGLVRGSDEATHAMARALGAREKTRRVVAEQQAEEERQAARQRRAHAELAQRDALVRGCELAAGVSAMERSSMKRWEQQVSGGREGAAIVRLDKAKGEQVVGRLERHTTRKAPSPKPKPKPGKAQGLAGPLFRAGSASAALMAGTARTGALLSYDSGAMAALSNR